jgi:hypothetical protein
MVEHLLQNMGFPSFLVDNAKVTKTFATGLYSGQVVEDRTPHFWQWILLR